MALDQSALLEVLEALKAAEVDDRIRQAALARAQDRLGIIPQPAADEIVRHCQVE